MFRAMIKKEFLLVFRDKHALLALFVMPAVFILIMSVAMRDQFTSKNIEFSLYANDMDKSQASERFIANLKADEKLRLQEKEEGAQFVLSVPKNYSKEPASQITINVKESIKSDQLEVFKSMLLARLLGEKFEAKQSLFTVEYDNSSKIPNSTQQSVPAWIVFGMFFIIIPMSTIYVNERKQNTLARLNSMNVSVFAMSVSKSVPYLVVNQIQVFIMLGVGMFLVPLFDTPALEINGSFMALGGISLALSFAAIGVSS